MPIHLKSSNPPKTSDATPRKRRSIFGKAARGVGWLAAGPIDWAGVRSIRRSAGFIGVLVTQLRSRPTADAKFRTDDDGAFDLQATAFLYGVSEYEMRLRLNVRRRRTARTAYAAFALGLAFVAGWLWQALSSPLSGARLTSTVEFLPFCGLLFLISFHNALLNYQVRVGRTASWREYLATSLPFLPR